eukprot:1180983-Lingulodinium_polyedra.AAC.1
MAKWRTVCDLCPKFSDGTMSCAHTRSVWHITPASRAKQDDNARGILWDEQFCVTGPLAT